jgi:hypothetical protein
MIDVYIEPECTKQFRWAILDEEKAKQLNICLVMINPNATGVSVDLSHKPSTVKAEDYLDYLQKSGIIVNNI